MEIVKSFFKLLDKGMVKLIFDHIENLFICTLILAIGFFVNKNPADWITSNLLIQFSGYIIIAIAIMLILLLIIDFMYKLYKQKYPGVLYIIIMSFYLFVSIRLTLILLDYRMQ